MALHQIAFPLVLIRMTKTREWALPSREAKAPCHASVTRTTRARVCRSEIIPPAGVIDNHIPYRYNFLLCENPGVGLWTLIA